MSEKSSSSSPPYASFSSFINLFNKLSESGVPSRIDPSVFGNASGSITYSVLAALKYLKLIDEDGIPDERFIAFANASETERKALLAPIIKSGYPFLFDSSLDLTKASAKQFDDRLREEFEIQGSTVDKVATFFINAAKYSEIPISPHIASRKSAYVSTSSRKSSKQRKEDSKSGAAHSPPPPPPATITEKALEYRLVDLMKEAGGNTDVMSDRDGLAGRRSPRRQWLAIRDDSECGGYCAKIGDLDWLLAALDAIGSPVSASKTSLAGNPTSHSSGAWARSLEHTYATSPSRRIRTS